MNLIDILFTIAAFGFTYSAVPQILKLYRTKQVVGISLLRQFLIFACVEITIAACLLSNLVFSMVMNIIQLIFVTTMILQQIHYETKPKIIRMINDEEFTGE